MAGGNDVLTTWHPYTGWMIVFAGPPDVPFLVAVDVTGTNSVTVRFQEPEHQDSAICTKFKGNYFTNPFTTPKASLPRN